MWEAVEMWDGNNCGRLDPHLLRFRATTTEDLIIVAHTKLIISFKEHKIIATYACSCLQNRTRGDNRFHTNTASVFMSNNYQLSHNSARNNRDLSSIMMGSNTKCPSSNAKGRTVQLSKATSSPKVRRSACPKLAKR